VLGDRVAVMRKGELQQVADPQTLYDRPVNLFVGGFIGSPSMNMIEAKLEAQNGGYVAKVGTQAVKIGAEELAARPALAGYAGKQVVLGIRPEDLEDAALATSTPDDRLPKRSTVSRKPAVKKDDIDRYPPLKKCSKLCGPTKCGERWYTFVFNFAKVVAFCERGCELDDSMRDDLKRKQKKTQAESEDVLGGVRIDSTGRVRPTKGGSSGSLASLSTPKGNRAMINLGGESQVAVHQIGAMMMSSNPLHLETVSNPLQMEPGAPEGTQPSAPDMPTTPRSPISPVARPITPGSPTRSLLAGSALEPEDAKMAAEAAERRRKLQESMLADDVIYTEINLERKRQEDKRREREGTAADDTEAEAGPGEAAPAPPVTRVGLGQLGRSGSSLRNLRQLGDT